MPLSGEKMLKLYLENGWTVLRQKGSHVRVVKGAVHESIPMHRELDKGMEHYLLKMLKQNTKEKDGISF